MDGKRVGGNGTCMHVLVDATCKEVLSEFLRMHASDYHLLTDTVVITEYGDDKALIVDLPQ
jgi:hypothetical protein